MTRINDLIVAYLNDEASIEDARQLFEWVRKDTENAKEFARFSLLHAQLRGLFLGEHNTTTSADVKSTSPQVTSPQVVAKDQKSNRYVYKAAVGALAASLLLGISFIIFLAIKTNNDSFARSDSSPDPSTMLATIVKTVDVEWQDQSFSQGDRVSSQMLALLSGYVRIQMDNGVEVTVQGPAELALRSLDSIQLTSGLLTASVPPGAEGFQVETPTANVVDLGTAFGVYLDENGASNVTVFDGKVNVSSQHVDDETLVNEGETLSISNSRIEKTPFDAERFEKLWPVSSGILKSTGAFRFTPPWPRRLRFVRSDDEIFVAPEGYALKLSKPLQVNITDSGEYRNVQELTQNEIAEGQQVRSFILHFHPEHEGDQPRFKRTRGSITFDRPVLGLIVRHEELAASSSIFPGRKAGEFLEHRQLELTGLPVGDRVTLSDDRRTVSLDLAAPRRFSDLVRVIVDASPVEISAEH